MNTIYEARFKSLEERVSNLETGDDSIFPNEPVVNWTNTHFFSTLEENKENKKTQPSKLNVFDAITMRVEEALDKTRLRYILPRGVGTTAYLIDLINNDLVNKGSVLFALQNTKQVIEICNRINSKVELCTPNTYSIQWDFDYIIADNCSSELIPNKVYLEIQSVDY